MGLSEIRGTLVWGPHNKDPTILGYYIRVPRFSETPMLLSQKQGGPGSAFWDGLLILTQRVQSTYIVECRVSMLGTVVMIWENIPHNST